MIIDIAKHRNGEVGDVNLRFRGKFAKFQNLNEDEMRVMTSKMNGMTTVAEATEKDDPLCGSSEQTENQNAYTLPY